ncbi:MAG: hypothetical protein LBH98_01260 [Chitinispirillales bacterium]|jgi:hypothetical protein|nr:hypothetical protein [Chitinispirillales bacterium]
MIQDFNPVGCIVQFVGEMDVFQKKYYQICDGGDLPYSANEKMLGDFELINNLMWQMLKEQNTNNDEYKDFNPDKRYPVPDLRGYFLVGAKSGTTQQDDRTEEIPLFKKDGESMHTLTIEEMPNHAKHGGYTRKEDSSCEGKDWTALGGGEGNTGDRGGDKPHNNMPPYFAVNYYIRVRV